MSYPSCSRHVQTKDDALFANGHEDAEKELDAKLNREVSQEEVLAEAEAEPVVENPPEKEEDEEDEEEEEEEDSEAAAKTDDDGDDDDDDDEEEEEEEEEAISADALDAESDVLSSHDHHHPAAQPANDNADDQTDDLDPIVLEDVADGEGELDLLEEVTADAASAEGEGEEEEEADDAAQDGEAEEEEVGVVEEEEEEGLAALPEAVRRKGAKRLKGIRRLVR